MSEKFPTEVVRRTSNDELRSESRSHIERGKGAWIQAAQYTKAISFVDAIFPDLGRFYLWSFDVILPFPAYLLGGKMNLTVRLGKLFYQSSTGVPALLPCSQLPS